MEQADLLLYPHTLPLQHREYQINLITLLAYLDSNNYDGNLALHLIDYDFSEIKCVQIKPNGFYEVYKSVLINKQIPETILPTP